MTLHYEVSGTTSKRNNFPVTFWQLKLLPECSSTQFVSCHGNAEMKHALAYSMFNTDH
jgi:hypothetical protein